MDAPYSPMSRLCQTFAAAFAIATAALMAIDFALNALFEFVLPSGVAIGAQIAAAWYAGHRYGEATPGLPDNGWFWRAGLYTALISIAVSIVFAVLAFFLLVSAEERELVYLLWSNNDAADTLGMSLATLIGIVVAVIIIWAGISWLVHRFVIAHAARKIFDPARAF